MCPQPPKANWQGPKHLREFADWVDSWPVNAFTAPVDKLKTFLDDTFTPESFAKKLKFAMDPYLSTNNERDEACTDDCKCCNCAHIRKFFVGHPFTPADLTEWKNAFDTAVNTRRAKAAKVAERKKAKRKALKARKKATAASGSDGDGDDEEGESVKGTPIDIVPHAVATRLALARTTKTKPIGTHKTSNTHRSAPPANTRNRVVTSVILVDTNYLCPLCSPCTSLICEKKHFGLPNVPLRDHAHGAH